MVMSSHNHAHMSHNVLAWRIFLTTYAAMLLTSALFASPLLAAHPDFAHEHPDNVPEHVHNLTMVLGHGAVTAVVDCVNLEQPPRDWLVLPPYSQLSRYHLEARRCRSPPVS